MSEWILGLGGSDHDFSAALMRDRDIVVAIEEERVSRRKHGLAYFYQNPVKHSVRYCLAYASLDLSDVESIVSSDLLPAKVRLEYSDRELILFPHHLCHAAAAYMMLPPGARAAVIVYDGMGSIVKRTLDNPQRNVRETFSFYLMTSSEIQCLGQTLGTGLFEHDDFPSGVNNSIGMFYEMITAALGFDILDAGKTMGLAAYGQPRFLSELKSFVSFGASFGDCFSCKLDDPSLREMIDSILGAVPSSFQVRADLAASAQAMLNITLLHCAQLFCGYSFDYVCLSGGCALNSVATSSLLQHKVFSVPLFVPPHAGDAGLGLGALWLKAQVPERCYLTFRGKSLLPAISRPGRTYTQDECMQAVCRSYPRLVHDSAFDEPEALARLLAEGKIVAVFRGPSEIGPRALGGRSILASPLKSRAREVLNRRIKLREPFRPLAPMILRAHFFDYFTGEGDAFMLRVAQATDRCRASAPAVVHVDGTARVQLVDEQSDPFLIRLLTAFYDNTGVPMLLNTSFNRRGEPIVETPDDAIDAFLGMKLDGIHLEGAFYSASDL